MDQIDYIEFASGDLQATRGFLEKAFGWSFIDYGPEYQAFADAGLDGGIDGSGSVPPGAPLVILKSDDLARSEAAVRGAGGIITKPPFAFPGGRRFQFREPGGNEMAVWSEV